MDRIAPFHLRTLLAIARLGTFHAAAERLNTTQPAVSARMRELELQLGVPLFQREGRRMTLTARGRQLVLEAESVLADFDTLLLRATDKAIASGIVRIGTGEIAAASCMPGFVSQAQARFPHVTLEIEVDLTARMLELLLAGTSDMVFLAGPVAHPAIRTISLGSLDLVWLARPDITDAARAGLPQSIWSLPAHSPVHHVVRDTIASGQVHCVALNTCNNVRTLVDIIARGGGVGLLPETMIRSELSGGALQEVYPRPERKIEFQAAIRTHEADPVISELFLLTQGLDIDPHRTK